MDPVIQSLLDTDLYKFTMMQTILHQHPTAQAEYAFKCRNKPDLPLAKLREEIEAQLDHLCSLRFAEDELAYLGELRFIKADFIDFLRLFQLQRRFIEVTVPEDRPDELAIRVQGPMLHCMLFEIYVLAIVNEIYFRQFPQEPSWASGEVQLAGKINLLKDFAQGNQRRNPFVFFDFGTRRRYSRDWHEKVVATLAHEAAPFMRGTSNVLLAKRYGLTPIGTMAHEYLQAFQAFGSRLRDFQRNALEHWVHEYRGDLGIALTDVVGTDAFLRDFDLYFCKLFDGLRHDSGDPFIWGDKALAHYNQMRIDPAGKMFVFSDGLDMEGAFALYHYFADRVRTGFGIGTSLSNDCGHEPLQIVMKLVRCNDQPVAKVSDSPGKGMCEDANFLNYLRDVFEIEQQ
ncbi:nicotinate phosphoribosyltransferase [Chitinimonas sp. BJB300]|uniref:nicotinate phosphoribosyltransferase n=1 Tax=Chitinimonas sp. BJB300 TaxID=1559339 RepID=UPI000C0EF201|nr:nicotinate phosphoribosyltransferase [Chitinimonas sp. BJB300]PHV10501.1 nicotinate phosphoribosyltransferase [Chitinimonas sp. BJB300]TSJ90184.1 nicotinate phosphoribosyltransferase [Chitinimonas sp. BJB300]